MKTKDIIPIPPAGFTLILRGEVQENDLLWFGEKTWEPAIGLEIGSPVTSFKGVARKNESL